MSNTLHVSPSIDFALTQSFLFTRPCHCLDSENFAKVHDEHLAKRLSVYDTPVEIENWVRDCSFVSQDTGGGAGVVEVSSSNFTLGVGGAAHGRRSRPISRVPSPVVATGL